MIKKLILLLLVVCGGVSAQAEQVTRRFMAINQVGWTSIKVYASYDNNGTETALSEGWPGTSLTQWKKVENWHDVWYFDLSIPDNVTTIKVVFNNGSSGGKNQTWDKTGIDISTEDKLFYIYSDDGSANNGISVVSLNYYISGWHENDLGDTDNFREMLTFNSDGTYSCDLDFTSYTARGWRCVFPSFASGVEGNIPWVSWDFCFRPKNSTSQFGFVNKQNEVLTKEGNQCWKFEAKVKYNCTFDFIHDKWSVMPYFTRTLPDAAEGYATFSSDYNVTVPEGLTAKYATEVTAGKITWENYAPTGIMAGQGALLEGTAGQEYKFTPATNAVAPSTNLMKAIDANTAASALGQSTADGKTNYIFTKVNNKVGFFKVNSAGSWVNEGTAYLQVPNDQIPSQSPEFIALDGETTGIANVNAETSAKNQYYTLDGRHVAQPTKGLYIVNGKKVIIK